MWPAYLLWTASFLPTPAEALATAEAFRHALARDDSRALEQLTASGSLDSSAWSSALDLIERRDHLNLTPARVRAITPGYGATAEWFAGDLDAAVVAWLLLLGLPTLAARRVLAWRAQRRGGAGLEPPTSGGSF